MLIVRKDFKRGLAIGGLLVAAGATYAIYAAVAGSGSKADETTDPNAYAVSTETGTNIDVSAPIEPTNSTVVDVTPGDANDPFTERNRTDGNNDTVARWDSLMNGERVAVLRPPTQPKGPENAAHTTDGNVRPVNNTVTTTGTTSGTAATAILPTGETYTIAAGDTFSSIAAAKYGSSSLFHHIVKANPNVDPSRMKIGTVINVPSLDSIKAVTRKDFASPLTETKAVDFRKEYRVVAGDSLNRIAIKLYGKTTKWQALYDLNKAAIGNDPAKLKLDMVLQLPEAPTVAAAR